MIGIVLHVLEPYELRVLYSDVIEGCTGSADCTDKAISYMLAHLGSPLTNRM